MKNLVFFLLVFFFNSFVSFSQDTISIKGLIIIDSITYECEDCFVVLDGEKVLAENFLPIFYEKINNAPDGHEIYFFINYEEKVGAILRAPASKFENRHVWYDNIPLVSKIKNKGG